MSRPLPPGSGQGDGSSSIESIELNESSWIAARAFGKAPSGAPDAEAHTNPVYVHLDDKAPYDRDSLDRLVARIDQQMAMHRKRSFAEKARVLDDFQKSRDILLRIRQAGGLAGRRRPRCLDRGQHGRGDRPQPADAHRRRADAVPPAACRP